MGSTIPSDLRQTASGWRNKMITIKNAWIKQGYSGEDHLNGSIDGFVGRQFRSVAEARSTIYRASVKDGSNATGSPIGLKILFDDGTTRMV
jgi:hypothetical protein